MVSQETVKNAVCFDADTKELFDAVIEQIGDWEEVFERPEDHRNASWGVGGFTYYSETEPFAREHAAIINSVLWAFEEEVGELKKDKDNPLNWLAWFALEHIVQLVIDYKEQYGDEEEDADETA